MHDSTVNKKLILLELNEVNFDVVKCYLEKSPGKYPWLEKLTKCANIRTSAEEKYEELEPWIQWVSVHTGLSFDDHRVYRLGDIVGSKVPQFFEVLESQGLIVGGISAMNAENRLKHPAYFIPDPWTKTPTDGCFWSEALAQAVGQAVNDNAQSKITVKSAVALLLGLLRFAKVRHYGLYMKLALNSRKASWRKALLLDLLLHDVHLALMASRKTDFSTVFLNAGAHIQHHYFFNAVPVKQTTHLRNPIWYLPETEDPFADMLEVYDTIIGEYLALKDAEIMVVTGLAQKPYDRIKYYWRLKDHAGFLKAVGIKYRTVMPRMTRDFLIEFDSPDQAVEAQEKLIQMVVTSDGEPLFGEIDNRGASLFVTLTYPHEIADDASVLLDGAAVRIKQYTTFVAIKNGMHQTEGFAFFSPGAARFLPAEHSHVKEIHSAVVGYFGVK